MDYLHPSPHSSRIWMLPASALSAAASWPQLLAGLPPRASTVVLPDTSPRSHCPTVPSPKLPTWPFPLPRAEEFALGIDPKSLHATVLMQTVYNAVIRHSGGFLKHMAISVTEKVKITVV